MQIPLVAQALPPRAHCARDAHAAIGVRREPLHAGLPSSVRIATRYPCIHERTGSQAGHPPRTVAVIELRSLLKEQLPAVAVPADNETAILDTLYTWAALNDPTELTLIRRRGEHALPLWEAAHQPGVVTNVAATLAASPGRRRTAGGSTFGMWMLTYIHTAHTALLKHAGIGAQAMTKPGKTARPSRALAASAPRWMPRWTPRAPLRLPRPTTRLGRGSPRSPASLPQTTPCSHPLEPYTRTAQCVAAAASRAAWVRSRRDTTSIQLTSAKHAEAARRWPRPLPPAASRPRSLLPPLVRGRLLLDVRLFLWLLARWPCRGAPSPPPASPPCRSATPPKASWAAVVPPGARPPRPPGTTPRRRRPRRPPRPAASPRATRTRATRRT